MPPVSKETLLRYCELVYETLDKDAKPHEQHGKIWEGKIIETFAGLGISNAHYSKIFSTMYEIGSLVLVQRGARGSLHRVALVQPPTMQLLDGAHGLDSPLTKATAHDRLSQRVATIEGRLEGIDLKKIIAEFDKRLKKVEGK